MMRDFVCPDCGTVIPNDTSKNRKRCPRCAYEIQRKRSAESTRERRRQMKENTYIRKGPPRKPEAAPAVQKQKEADAEQNARTREQRKQCQSCRWRMYDAASRRTVGCDFLLKNGHMRDRGEGPGKCGSYAPLGKKDGKQERVKLARRLLSESEANNASNTGGWLRKENG